MTNRHRHQPAEGTPIIMTSSDVSKMLQISQSRLSRMRKAGEGPPAYWLGEASPRYLLSEVLDWIRGTAA